MADKTFTFFTDTIQHKSYVDKKTGKTRYFIEGHIDSEKLDLVNDIVTKSCMADISTQFKGRNIKLDLDHETLIGKSDIETQVALTKIPLGKAVKEQLDSKGNYVTYELNPTWQKFDSKGDVTMNFKTVWENIENDMYDAFSIAYVPVATSNEVISGKTVRMLDKVNLINVALTGNPINPDASITNVMTKSLAYLKSKEKNNIKYQKKAFDKDGAHAHTKEYPLGDHTHPEIQRVMNDELNWINERINYVHDRIDDIVYPKQDTEDDSIMVGKSNDGDSMSDETKTQKKAGDEDASKKDGETSTDTQDTTTESKSIMLEVKSMFEKTNEQITALVEANKTLAAKSEEFEKILAKARPAAKGAESKSEGAAAQEKTEVKSVGPLDMI